MSDPTGSSAVHGRARRRSALRLSLAASLILLVTSAAPAAVQGAQGVTVATSSVGTASALAIIPFDVTITNSGGTSLTQVKLEVTSPSNAEYKGQGTSQNCSGSSGGVTCSLPNMASGASTSLTFYFEILSGSSVTFARTDTRVLVKENQSDPNDPGRSSTYYANGDTVVSLSGDPNAIESYATPDGETKVGTTGSGGSGEQLGQGNQQATLVIVNNPGSWIRVLAKEETGDEGCTTKKRACFGELSKTDVPIAEGKLFSVWIRWDKSVIPKGKSARNIGVAHKPDGGSWEQLPVCKSDPPSLDADCREAGMLLADGDVLVKVWLKANGVFKGN
jgi:hypothetical protein